MDHRKIQADDQDANVNSLQEKYVLVARREDNQVDPFENYEPAFKAICKEPVPYSLEMDADDYYDTFFTQWNITILKGDKEILKVMAADIKQGVSGFDDLTKDVRDVLEHALKLTKIYG